MSENATKTRTRNFDRQYSDSEGKAELQHDGAAVLSFSLPEIHADMLNRAALRYLSDIVSAVGNAAIKAGKTVDEAQTAMEEALAKLRNGSFTFRSGAGAGGLSLEDEKRIIAETLVELNQRPDTASAMAVIEKLYAVTKTNAKGQTMRPEYNKLKNIPQIKLALTNASKADTGLADLLGGIDS